MPNPTYHRDRYANDPEFRARVLARGKRWREANPEKVKAHSAQHYAANRETRIAAAAEYHRSNPRDRERQREYERQRYAQSNGKARAQKVVWEKANPELVRELRRRSIHRRRARLRGLPAEPYTMADILVRDGTRCVLCEEELDLDARWPDRRAATVEHLECLAWPDSAGDVLANVAVACFGCNNSRRTRPHPRAAAKRAELLRLTWWARGRARHFPRSPPPRTPPLVHRSARQP